MLGNKGILWCFADENEAVKAKNSYSDCVLWKLDVPESSLRYLCNVTWHYILKDNLCVPPEKFKTLMGLNTDLKLNESGKMLRQQWLNKKQSNVLWDMLIVDRFYGDCVDSIVFHPLEKDFYKGNVNFE